MPQKSQRQFLEQMNSVSSNGLLFQVNRDVVGILNVLDPWWSSQMQMGRTRGPSSSRSPSRLTRYRLNDPSRYGDFQVVQLKGD